MSQYVRAHTECVHVVRANARWKQRYKQATTEHERDNGHAETSNSGEEPYQDDEERGASAEMRWDL